MKWAWRIVAGVALVGWVLFAWLATHRSHSPEYFGRYSLEYMMFLGVVLTGVVIVTLLAVVLYRHPAILRVGTLGGIGLMLGSTVVTLLVAEILVRSLDLMGASVFEEVMRYMTDLEPDDELGFKHRPDLDVVYQGVAFRTNALGLRDRPIPEPSADEVRILLLGDSVTLGWGVEVEDTFGRRIEPALEGKWGRPVRTLNTAVSGYNTEQELAFLKRHGESLAPDAVLLIYVENDIEPMVESIVDQQQRWEHPPGINARLLRWSWLYRLIYFIGPDVVRPSALPADDTGRERSMQALIEISRWAARHDAPFAVVLYGYRPDAVTDALQQDIVRVAEDEGFPFFDMRPWFEGMNLRSVTNSFADSHPNAEGHRIIAEGLVRSLAESEIWSSLEKAD